MSRQKAGSRAGGEVGFGGKGGGCVLSVVPGPFSPRRPRVAEGGCRGAGPGVRQAGGAEQAVSLEQRQVPRHSSGLADVSGDEAPQEPGV